MTYFDYSNIRKKAEELIKNENLSQSIDSLSNEEIKKIFHELRVHQIELELQSEELKNANMTLQYLKDKYQDLYDFAPVGYITIDINGMIRQVNVTMAEMLYKNRENLIKRSLADFLSGESKDYFYSLLSKAIRDKRFPDTELVFLKDNKTKLYTRIKSNFNSSEEDFGHSFRLAIVDISKQKQFETELMIAKEELERIFDAIPFIITIQDNNFRILKINKYGEQFLSKKTNEILGKNCYELFCELNSPCGYCPIHKMMNIKKPYSYELRHDKLNKHFLVSVAPIIRDNQITNVVHIAIDITDKKIIEEQLNQAKKMEAIGTLSAGIAHEFNNILTAIIGYTELALLDKSLPDKTTEYLNTVKNAGLRARDLVAQILLFSRKDEKDKSPFNPLPIFKETVKMLKLTLPSSIEIREYIDQNVYPIIGTSFSIQQILMNLASNSAYAMKDKKNGLLELGLQNIHIDENMAKKLGLISTGKYVLLYARDNGTGIPPENLSRIFEPFFTTKKPGEGTGMGLATVYGIVKESKGTITVESKVGEGTEFRLYFPCANNVEENNKKINNHISPILASSRKILWVDDEEMIVNLGKVLLDTLGCKVVIETNPENALEIFKNDPDDFELVITDLTMPKMNGIELSKEMIKVNPNINIILFTGYSENYYEDEIKNIGIKYVLKKPVTFSELNEVLKNIKCKRENSDGQYQL